MNFTDAVNEVKETTKRPELVNRIRREVNAAISFYCQDRDHARDYAEQTIDLNAQEYVQSFPLSDLTRFRKFRYIRRSATKYLSLVGDSDIFRGDPTCLLKDKYYIVGSSVNVSLAQLSSTLVIGYYMYPPALTDGSPTFWMLEIAPYMVIDKACASIFKSIGDEKSMQTHAEAALEAYHAFIKDQATNT